MVSLEDNMSKTELGQIIWIPKKYRDLPKALAPITTETLLYNKQKYGIKQLKT